MISKLKSVFDEMQNLDHVIQILLYQFWKGARNEG
jgi:hypothetical protein